jgi:hypothetical protein
MPSLDPAADAWIAIVLANAGALREAGVESISYDGRAVTLRPPDPPEPDIDAEDDDEPEPPRRPYE